MKLFGLLGLISLTVISCTTNSSLNSKKVMDPAGDEYIKKALNHPDRPAADKALDADRRPDKVLDFYGIKPGMRVADLLAGGGYYSEVLSKTVGPHGIVYAQNIKWVLDRFAAKPLAKRLSRKGLENIKRTDQELETLSQSIKAGELDAAMMVLFYHDTYWLEIDREKMNKEVFHALKPGGVYGVIDHSAKSGSGVSAVKTLHRVESSLVKEEILKAGFILESESVMLRNPGDNREISVFDKKIRRKTDRFVLKFRKPKA